ncbi:hypothetical protein AAIR98_001528 [Elusimicrobium simillimum]|uniref:nitroreductase family protein n=1 Tax=Elusimicrobium simillimum TaxID=3143438 RepID=UPI003C6F7710
MTRTFKEAVKNRRSCYAITGKSEITDKQIQEILEFALLNTPSAFNSQSTRMVLLLGEHHKKLWDIVMGTLRARVPAEKFEPTENKINSFAAGYGTVLFFEDESVVKGLQDKFPTYAGNFPPWSEQTGGMHTFVVWTMLEDAGFGASIQHYNPIIDEEVKKTWDIADSWKLKGQMPFGIKTEEPGEKEFGPLETRLKIFK